MQSHALMHLRMLSLNVVSLEPFWYPMETDQFRTQLFACDHLRRSCSSVCICYSSLPDCDPLSLCYHYNLVLFRYSPFVSIVFTDKLQKSLNYSLLMNNPNSINSHQSPLLEVDYAIEYETDEQLSVFC